MKLRNVQKETWLVLTALFFLIVVSNVEYTEQITDNSLIRIHVLANSNSASDQALKMEVKDAVVQELEPILNQAASIEESRQILQSQMPHIKETAEQTIEQYGCDYPVTLQYGRFDFPVKYYGSFSLPAGNYEALRILIGEGAGRNWWCVLFPPLCFTDSNVSVPDQYTSISPDTEVVIKFKSIEWLKNKKREFDNRTLLESAGERT